MYPSLNEFFYLEKKQPLYSSFIGTQGKNSGSIKVNASGSEILALCDGRRNSSEIIDLLTQHYGETREVVAEFVNTFLSEAEQQKMLILHATPTAREKSLLSCGGTDYWTPDAFSIELTELCPLKCKHCYIGAGLSKGVSLSDELIDKLIAEVALMHPEIIQLTGGEPFLHPNFWEILDRTLALNAVVHIFTSGVVSSPEALDRLSQYTDKNVSFQISIDGLQEYHDMFRGVPGSFDRTVKFTKDITKLGFPVTIATCLNDQPYDEIKKLCQIVKGIGVRSLRVGSISEQGRAEENQIDYTKDKYYRLKHFQKKLSDEEDTAAFKVQFLEDVHIIQSEYSHNCGLGTTMLKISPTGEVNPCLMCDIKIGDISEETLVDIQKKWSRVWERIQPPDAETCASCEKEKLCHDCVVEGMIYGEGNSQCHWWNKEEDLQELHQKCKGCYG